MSIFLFAFLHTVFRCHVFPLYQIWFPSCIVSLRLPITALPLAWRLRYWTLFLSIAGPCNLHIANLFLNVAYRTNQSIYVRPSVLSWGGKSTYLPAQVSTVCTSCLGLMEVMLVLCTFLLQVGYCCSNTPDVVALFPFNSGWLHQNIPHYHIWEFKVGNMLPFKYITWSQFHRLPIVFSSLLQIVNVCTFLI
jgi:hypothetical protein